MKLGDLRKIFNCAERMYREASNQAIATALKDISSLCDGRETVTVGAFARLVANGPPIGPDDSFQNGGGRSVAVSELRNVLANIQHLCASAGAKAAVTDLQIFSDLLQPYSDAPVDKACVEVKLSLSQSPEKPGRARTAAKSTAAPDQNLIQQHLTELREAGTDQRTFELAFKKLKASKSLKSPEVAEIARQFSLSITAYKSKKAAYSDIEKAFVRQARFENKLR
jgi:hypothetical protein